MTSRSKKSLDNTNVFAVNLLKCKGPKVLATAMENLHEVLREVAQDDEDERPDGMDAICAQLVDPIITGNADKNVRLTAACCLVDILRIYAPDAPYCETELQSVFELIIKQLHGLSTVSKEAHTKKEQRYAYVLESLATIKSCIILTELIQQGHDGAEEQMSELFECLLSNIRADQSVSIHAHVLDVLTCCIEELDTIPVPLLETFLVFLLPSSKSENPTAHGVVQVLLQRSFNKLQHPVGTYVTALLEDKHVVEASELKEHIYSLVFELHKTHHQLMLYILPRLVEYLEVEDDIMRERIVQLVRRLFASSVGDYSNTYPQHFKTLCRRFKDRSAVIRKHMLEFGRIVLTRQEEQSFLSKEQTEMLMKEMENRLSDKDDAVRQQAVHDVCDMAFQSLDCISSHLLRVVGDRYSDKRPDIRKDVITGLARIYSEHMGKIWEASMKDGELVVDVPNSVESKLGWVPQLVLIFACSKHNPDSVKVRARQLFDDYIITKDLPPEVRTAGLVYVYQRLEESGKNALAWLLQHRSMKQMALAKYVSLVRAKAADPKNLDHEANLNEFFSSMLTVFPTPDKKATLISKLSSSKDRNLYNYLDVIASPDSSSSELAKARESIPKLLGSKTPLGEYSKDIIRSAGMGFGGPEMLRAALNIASHAAAEGEDELCSMIMDLNELMMKCFPRLVRPVLSDMLTLYAELGQSSASKTSTSLRTRLLKVLEASGEQINFASYTSTAKGKKKKNSVDEEESAHEFAAELERLCLKEGDVEQSKRAIRVLSSLAKTSPTTANSQSSQTSGLDESSALEIFTRIISTLTSPKSLKVDNKRLLATLHILREAAKNFPDVFEPYAQKVRSFVLGEVILTPFGESKSKGKKSQHQDMSEDSARLCAAIKLLSYDQSPPRNIADEVDLDIDSEEDTFEGTVLDLLFQILDGDVPGGRGRLSPKEMTQVRRVAACAALRIGAKFDLTANQWHALAWTIQDSEERIRHKFMREVARESKRIKLPLRFMAYLVFASSETDHNEKKNVTDSLMAAIKRLRQEHIRRISALSDDSMLDESVSVMEASMMMDDGQDETRCMLNTSLMPEYILPYVVHLLAHHPDFPVSKTDTSRIKVCERNLKALLEPLILSLGHNADNISFLLQMFSMMVEHQDVLDGDTFRIHLIASIGKKVLKKMIKSPESIKAYPGTIYLPTNLFCLRDEDHEQTAREEELDINAVVSPKGKALNSPSGWGSPIAPVSASSLKHGKPLKQSSSQKKLKPSRRSKASSEDEASGKEEEVDEDDMEELLDMRMGGFGSPDYGRRNKPRGAKQGVEYLVKWSGKDASESTWEPAAKISDKSLITDYEKRSKQIEEAAAEINEKNKPSSDSEESEEELAPTPVNKSKNASPSKKARTSKAKPTPPEDSSEEEEEEEEVVNTSSRSAKSNSSKNASRSKKARTSKAKPTPPEDSSEEEEEEEEEVVRSAKSNSSKNVSRSKKARTSKAKPTPPEDSSEEEEEEEEVANTSSRSAKSNSGKRGRVQSASPKKSAKIPTPTKPKATGTKRSTPKSVASDDSEEEAPRQNRRKLSRSR